MADCTIDIRGTDRIRSCASPRSRRCWRKWEDRTHRGRGRPRRVFVAFADELTPALVRSLRILQGDVFVVVRPKDLNLEAMLDRVAILPPRMRRILVEDQAVLDRLSHVSSTILAPGHHAIMFAWRDGAKLVCVNEQFDAIHIPEAALRKFLALEKADLDRFDVSETGSYLHWPKVDAHMGWSQLLALVDEAEALRQKQESVEFNLSLGRAIWSFRESRNLEQDAIQNLTDRHLRRIETGEQRATLKALESLARAHGLSLSGYLKELSTRQSADKRPAWAFPAPAATGCIVGVAWTEQASPDDANSN